MEIAEWASRGVRVNSISPGYTRTQLVQVLLDTPEGQDKAPQWLARTPAGRMGEVTDLQGAVVYLASPASDFMTGHDMIVGRWMAHAKTRRREENKMITLRVFA